MKRKIVGLAVALLLLCGMLPVSASGSPDLTVETLSWTGNDGQVKPDTKLEITAVIKNTGTAAVSEPITVEFAFGTEVIGRATHTAGLAAGGRAAVKLSWVAKSGDKMISARVLPSSAEQSVKNNSKQSNLRVANDRLEPAHNKSVINKAGMFNLTFSDDFNDLSGFDNASTGREGYKWYIKRRWAQQDMTPSDYSVKNGVLTMAYEDDTYTIGASTVDCKTHVGYTFNKGYLEARVRIPQPFYDTNSKTAIWSVPLENWGEGLTNGRYVEMDWMEYFGKGDFYGTTLHDMETKAGGTKNWYSSSNGSNIHLNDGMWHVMGWLWEDNSLRCFIDSEEVFTQTWGPNEMPTPVNRVQSGDIQFEGVFDVMDQQNMMLFIAGSEEMPMEFDYVRIWQKGGTPPTVTTTTKRPTVPDVQQTTTTVTTTTKRPTVSAGTTVVTEPSETQATTTVVTEPTVSEPTASEPTADAVVPPSQQGTGILPWLSVIFGSTAVIVVAAVLGVAVIAGAIVLVVILVRKKK